MELGKVVTSPHLRAKQTAEELLRHWPEPKPELLVCEALAAQGGHIDAVSGATYTSEGYIGSLPSAVDQARG